MSNQDWIKSSYSGSQANCIEVKDSKVDRILVRDTKDRSGPMLRFTPDAWRRFAKELKSLANHNVSGPFG
jgi:hypothetical protein